MDINIIGAARQGKIFELKRRLIVHGAQKLRIIFLISSGNLERLQQLSTMSDFNVDETSKNTGFLSGNDRKFTER